MKHEIADRWIAALRSGKYQQGQGMLRDGDSFCCLGVLCDLYAEDNLTAWRIDLEGNFSFNGERYALAPSVREWAGTISAAGGRPSQDPCLAQLNDEGIPFSVIADIIEAEWETL